MEEFRGRVVAKPFGTGSKSAHVAVYLETKSGAFVLRRQGGNPFRDEQLDRLVGKTIRCTGEQVGYTLIMNDWEELSG